MEKTTKVQDKHLQLPEEQVSVCTWHESLRLFTKTVLKVESGLETVGVKRQILTATFDGCQRVRYGDAADVPIIILVVHCLLKRLDTDFLLYTLHILEISGVSARNL